MARTAAEIAIAVTTDAADAVRGFDSVGSAAESMSRQVDTAGATAEQTSRRLGITADAADDLGGKAGKATGALGALSSGFELLGPSGSAAATALQSTALATDFLSGVGDSLNLVMESTIVKNVRLKAATVAKAVAEKAAAAGTAAMTAAQWALNAALSANPIGLVVLAIVALVAGFGLAYKKSEAFRTIVNVVMHAVVGYIKLVTFPIRTLIGFIADLVEKIPGVSKAFRAVRDTAKSIGKALLKPFQEVKDIIDKIISAIGKIKIPKLPGQGGGVPFVPGIRAAVGDYAPVPTVVNNINLNGLLDTRDGLRALEQLLARQGRRLGLA